MRTILRTIVSLLLSVVISVSSGSAAVEIDTTKIREPVAPKRSVGQTILYSPALLIKAPLKLLKGSAKVGLKFALGKSATRIFLQKLFGTNRPLHPLISYGSKPSLEGGLGLRLREVFKPSDQIRAKAWYSVNQYQRYEARYQSPALFGANTGFTLRADYNWMPRESFYGLGNDTDKNDEVSLTYETGRVEGELAWQPCEYVGFVFTGGYRSYNLYDGGETELLTDLDRIRDTLGLDSSAFAPSRLWHVGIAARFDQRNHPGQPTSGGTQELTASLWRGTGVSDGLSYWQTRVNLRQYFHLFRKRTLAVRLSAASLKVIDDTDNLGLPAYLLQTLGGENDLRGYKPNRFQDHALAIVSLEYRYPIWQLADGFVFIDEGRVFESFDDDFSWRQWHYSFGFGFRVWDTTGEKLRLTAAWSDEEVRFYFNFGQDL